MRALLFLIALLLAAGPAAAASAGPELVVEAPDRYAGLARTLRALDSGRLADVARLVGLERPGPPVRVVLAPEDSEPARGVPPWVAGYAYGAEGLVVLLPARSPSYPDASLEDVLRHEVAHVLVARAANGQPVPRWFNEGVAMMAGRSWGLEDRSRLTYALLTDKDLPLAELDRRFAGEGGSVESAYAISGAFVRDLFDRHGAGVAAGVLAGVGRGLVFEEAFEQAAGMPLAQAEDEFWSRQSFWYRWVPILSSSVTLWMLITLLALAAIRRRRARDAALREMWDEEERQRLAQLDPPADEWVN